MEVVVKKSKSEIVVSLSGAYVSEDYGQIIQHFADPQLYKNKKLKIDISNLSGYEYKLLNLILVLAKDVDGCKSLELILNDSIESKTKWFEPVWSSVVKRG